MREHELTDHDLARSLDAKFGTRMHILRTLGARDEGSVLTSNETSQRTQDRIWFPPTSSNTACTSHREAAPMDGRTFFLAAATVFFFAELGTGCGTRSGAAQPARTANERADIEPKRDAVDVRVELHSPTHVRWVPTTLGPSKPTLSVVVTNRGSAQVDVSNLRVHLEAIREAVSFRCAEEVGAAPGAREPKTLQAGATFAFERTLDCALPLVGNYAIRVGVSFGRGAWAELRDVRAFNLRVFAAPEIEPRAIEPIPGLWGALGATSVMEGRASGSGRLVVAIVNGGRTPLELPRFRLALRVYRVGVPIPCEDAPIDLKTPAVLGVGESYHEPVEVSCLGLGVVGKYDIAGLLQMGSTGAGWQTELGRLRVEISNDPTSTIPLVPSLLP